MKTVLISIPNWQKYNARNDRTNHSWFRLENSAFMSQDLFDLKPEQRWVWICLLSLASRNQLDEFPVKISWLSQSSNVSVRVLEDGLYKMKRSGMITVREPCGDHTVSVGSLTDITDITDITDNTRQCSLPDTILNELYQLYPKKVGKSDGFKKLSRELKTTGDAELFRDAVLRYKSHCEIEQISPKFIKHFSSFVNCWRDWLADDAGISQVQKSKTAIEQFAEEYNSSQELPV